MAEQKTGEVGMHSFITANEFIGKGKARHQTTLLQPENGGKGAREKDPFDSGEGDKAFGKCRTLVGDPADSPVSLALNARNCLDSVEEVIALGRVLDVGVNEK